eukprot:6974609-Prymnesium_polylepis.1
MPLRSECHREAHRVAVARVHVGSLSPSSRHRLVTIYSACNPQSIISQSSVNHQSIISQSAVNPQSIRSSSSPCRRRASARRLPSRAAASQSRRTHPSRRGAAASP